MGKVRCLIDRRYLQVKRAFGQRELTFLRSGRAAALCADALQETCSEWRGILQKARNGASRWDD
jgi:hypothetical protein